MASVRLLCFNGKAYMKGKGIAVTLKDGETAEGKADEIKKLLEETYK